MRGRLRRDAPGLPVKNQQSFVHLLAEVHEDDGHLSTGGARLGHQGSQISARDQAGVHGPLHGGQSPLLNIILVGEAGEGGAGIGVQTLDLNEAVENGGRLLPGEGIIGTKGAIVITGHNVLAGGPSHRLGVPGVAVHVGEGGSVCLGLAGKAVEDGDQHAAGGGHFGGEGVGAGTGHETAIQYVVHRLGIPGIGSDIVKDVRRGGSHKDGLHGDPSGGLGVGKGAVGLLGYRNFLSAAVQNLQAVQTVTRAGNGLQSYHVALLGRGGIDFHAALTGGLDGSAGRGAGAAGALVFSEEIGENFSGGHVGVAVGVLQTGGIQVPGELAGVGAGEKGVVLVGLESGVVALAPLGIVAAHVGLSQRHGLAVLALTHAGELDAAAGLAGLAVGGGGVEDDHAAVLTDTQADPDVAVHAEDVAGLEVPGGGEFLGPGTEVVGLGKGLSHLGGAHDIAVVAALGVHDVVGDPGHIGGAVHAGKVVLVPGVVGVVGMGGIAAVLVGVVGVLALEEVNPGLGDADGGGLGGGAHVLPVPASAVDVEGGAGGLQSGGQEVLQGADTGLAVDGSLVVLSHEGEVDGGVGVAVDLDGLAHGEFSGLGGVYLAAAGLRGDAVDGSALQGDLLAVHGDGVLVGSGDLALGSGLGGLHLGDGAVLYGNIVDIALGQLVLQGVVVGVIDPVALDRAVHAEQVGEVALVLGGDSAVVLHAQIDSLYSRRLQGLWCAVICRCRNHDQ